MNKISAVYKITNTITGDFYIGSSKDVKKRWTAHKAPSRWNEHPNCPMYLDMQKYGVDRFEFQVIAEVEPAKLKEVEQQFIETLKPTYNNYNAKGVDIERKKETRRKNEKSDKRKEHKKKYKKEYDNQLCLYKGEILTLSALSSRFAYRGIPHPTIEAKKYLLEETKDNIKKEEQ